jgi:hypothetical protein
MTLAMKTKKVEPATTGTTAVKKYLNPTINHYAAIHHNKYRQQPQGMEMGRITNDIKRKGHAKLHTTEQLLKAFSNGQSVLLSNFEIDTKDSIRFISSSAFAIDVDDDDLITDPLEVLTDLKEICTGLFYTFSHEKKGNRYRLLFQLDQAITNQNDLADLIDYMIHYLKNKGLPVDGKAKSPTQVIRGGNKGYVTNDLSTTLKTNLWLQAAQIHNAKKRKAVDEQRKKNADQLKEHLNNPVTFEELKSMCNAIGHIPSGAGDAITKKWLQVVYAIKHQVQMELIDDEQGFELFSIISGGESNEKYWNSIKPSGFVTVGTIVHHAQQAGFRRRKSYGYALQDTPEVIETEHIKIPVIKGKETYIPVAVAKELIQRQQSLLVDSATGSGKTYSFIKAFKELATPDNHYYIFAAPTRAIAEQTAKAHALPCIIGGIKNLKNEITRLAVNGQRVFVCVYDKTAELVSHLLTGVDYGTDLQPKFTIVVDEIHQITQAYNYRFKVIDQLEQLSKIAISLIGLSGTMDDLLKTNFEKMIVIDTNGAESPCLDYRVFTYDTRVSGKVVSNNADLMLIPVIRGLLQQTKVLLYLNSKERIQRIARLLKREGITCSIVTSDSKQSATYKKIVENEEIDDNVQVVLSTVVIADGVNIKNGLDWSCVVVADDNSPIFNPSTIKQISNRFRNQYRYFGLYMRTPNPNYNEIKRFNIESDYTYKLKTVSQYVNYLNEEFRGDSLKDFIPSNVERVNGIYYKSTDEKALIEFNPLFVRHQSMQTKERYYSSHRQAFINEVGRAIGRKVTGVFNVNEEVAKNGSDLSGLLAEIEQEKEEKKLEADELRTNFTMYFDESIYLALKHGDNPDSIEVFKKNVHADQYAATVKNVKISDYETCMRLGRSVKRRADINRYVNDIQALADIAKFEHIKKAEITKRIFNELMKMVGVKYLSSDFTEITEIRIPKKMKVKKTDVQEALKLFHKHLSRTENDRFTSIKPLSVSLVANNESRLISEEAVKFSLLKLICSKKQRDKNIFLPAIEKKYGVTLEEHGEGKQIFYTHFH